MNNSLAALSDGLAAAVERAGRSVVAVNGRARTSSSGIHWRPGVIVTAEHAIRREEDIRVAADGGRVFTATLAGRDPSTDLAVLKIDSADLPVAEFGDSDRVRAGGIALAVGRSQETGLNVSMGVVNAVGGSYRNWRGGRIDRYLRLDLSLYLGSSGAAFADANGLILGLATNALSRVAPIAIPASTIDRVMDELLRKGHISRSYLGVGLQPVPLPEALQKKLGLSRAGGTIVLSVEADGPAGRAGILIGDVVVEIGGKPVVDTDDVQAALEPVSPGKNVSVRLIRGGEVADRIVVAGERPGRRA